MLCMKFNISLTTRNHETCGLSCDKYWGSVSLSGNGFGVFLGNWVIGHQKLDVIMQMSSWLGTWWGIWNKWYRLNLKKSKFSRLMPNFSPKITQPLIRSWIRVSSEFRHAIRFNWSFIEQLAIIGHSWLHGYTIYTAI
jgi:hypothetical protein